MFELEFAEIGDLLDGGKAACSRLAPVRNCAAAADDFIQLPNNAHESLRKLRKLHAPAIPLRCKVCWLRSWRFILIAEAK